MVMTRKDFKAIAEIIDSKTITGDIPTIDSDGLIMSLIDCFRESNPNFHGLKFFEAASERQLTWKESQREQREYTINWSEKYYEGLSPEKHGKNNIWFRETLAMLTDTGIIFVPNLGKTFNKQGRDINA